MFYSKSTGGFYPMELIEDYKASGSLPADLVEIAQEQYEELHLGHAAGKEITLNSNGYPMLTNPPPIPMPVLIEAAKVKVRALRGPLFASLAGMQSQALANSDMATAKAISAIQDQLKALPDVDLSGCKSEADIAAQFAAAWLAIVSQVPPSVASAFKEVLS